MESAGWRTTWSRRGRAWIGLSAGLAALAEDAELVACADIDPKRAACEIGAHGLWPKVALVPEGEPVLGD